MFGKSWKTATAGILMLVGGAVRIIMALKAGTFTEEAIMTSLTTILGGLGLLFAKDSDVTGGTRPQ